MKKFEDILGMVTCILFFVVYIFYRHNITAVCIVAVLLWINVIIITLRKKTLPKHDYYIHKPVIAKYIRWVLASIAVMLLMEYIFLIATKGYKYHKEFDGFIIIFTPMILLNLLNDDRRIYFYDKGLVWYGKVLEFSNIDSFQWKEDVDYELNIYHENTEYNIKVSKTKFEYIDKILKANIKLVKKVMLV
ncbi:hypothetical protein [Marinisporobacter balticus]|uniref:DUF5673 domain-containing protein n=1 Tax=Marinisporobacter balticus TaxID=2018667 RepID=A0A4V2SBY7_9FIRM|nr:hypothetical protein [Marinisporobacter balticus]TCO77410.1 hypothetical protein EV214_10652 [Marinisporobacter balticus]